MRKGDQRGSNRWLDQDVSREDGYFKIESAGLAARLTMECERETARMTPKFLA